MAFDVTKIEERIDRAAAGAVAISYEIGGVHFTSMMEVMEFAKLMAVAGAAIPPHLRGNPGACLAISIQALEWRMSPFAVANKSYLVNNRGEERIAYESQLVHAVIEARAPMQGRLRHEIVGEGDERRCKVWGTFKGEADPHTYTSETLAKLRDARGRNDRGQVKGSPLWETNPEVQLFYSASRQWCRLYAPDVLLGIYAKDELDAAESARDVTPAKPVPAIADRLKGGKGKRGGFDADHVEREVAGAKGMQTIEGTAAPAGGDGGPSGQDAPGAAGPASQGAADAGRTDASTEVAQANADAGQQAGSEGPAGSEGATGAPIEASERTAARMHDHAEVEAVAAVCDAEGIC